MLKAQLRAIEKKHLSDVSNEMLQELVSNTPVDTGFARAQWTKVAISDTDVAIVNTAPYIDYLNNGSSAQAPSHFIESVALQYGVPNGKIVDTPT